MKRLSGSFTVEASILVPILMAVCVIFVYLGIYAYDKTLMIQDVNAITAIIRDENSLGGEDIGDVFEKAFSEIKAEHPYLAMNNLKMDYSVRGKKVHIELSGDFNAPVYRNFRRKISAARDVVRINPVERMYLAETVKKAIKGENNDDTDGIRN